MKANKTEAQLAYDNRRKEETKRRLLKGINDLKRLSKHKDKGISKYELSKATGVTRKTIDRFPDVLEHLERVNAKIAKEKPVEVPNIPVDKIKTLNEASGIILYLQSLLKELEEKSSTIEKLLTQRDATIADLQSEIMELKAYIKEISRESN